MFFSIATTHAPATDLGFLLMKHPDRVHETELPFGAATLFYPEANEARCEAVLTLDIDPVGLVRGRGAGEGLLDQYVNDRPYAATSFLSVALNRALRTAMTGVSRERPELAATALPLALHVSPLPARGGEEMVRSLFEPLGWSVALERVPGPDGPSRYVSLRLNGVYRVADALSHIYVLIPVLDDDKHYWVGDDEVDKLVSKGGAWLAGHPQKELIARRYLKNRRGLARLALARLAPEEEQQEASEAPSRDSAEEKLEAPIRLNDQRMDALLGALAATGATSVADLGCGEGKLLTRLVKERKLTRIIGLDASVRTLERASDRLKLDIAGGPARDRVQLLHGALTYRDDRWKDVDAAVLVEVIEHLDLDRVPALTEVVFGAAKPKTVIVTTPNAEHNALFANLPAGKFRHPDHRFEWTRAEFRDWVSGVEEKYGYGARIEGIGADHESYGPPTQMAVFTR